MSDPLRSLLDDVLEATSARASLDSTPEPAVKAPEPWPSDVEELVDLADVDLRTFLSSMGTDDLLCVLAEGSPLLRERVVGQLAEASATWLRSNLAAWVPATEASKRESRRAALELARDLVASGRIARPDTAESHGKAVDAEMAQGYAKLLETLAGLVDAAKKGGPEILRTVVHDEDHPLLVEGLRALWDRESTPAMERLLAERVKALELAHRRSLEAIRQAVLSMARGEDSKTYRTRLG